VAKVCKALRSAWMATREQRPWLRPAPTQPTLPEEGSYRSSYVRCVPALPDGERLYVSVGCNDGTSRLLVLGQAVQSIGWAPQTPCVSLLATKQGLYAWDTGLDGTVWRIQLTEERSLNELARKDMRICDLAATPDGSLFASVRRCSGEDEAFVAALDPLTLEERFRFGSGRFDDINGLYVDDAELYVNDWAEPDGEEFYGRFQVFSLSGEYLREVRVDDMP